MVAVLVGRHRDEEVDRQHRRADPGGEARCASIPALASSSSRSTRTNAPLGQATGTRRSGRGRVGGAAADRRSRASSASASATWRGARHSSMPRHGRPQAVGDLVGLRSGLEQRDGGGATRHRRRQRPRCGRTVKPRRARSPLRRGSPSPSPGGSSPPGVSIGTPEPAASRRPVAAASQQRRRRAGGERERLAPAAPAGDRLERGHEVVDVDEVAHALRVAGDHDRRGRRARGRRTRRSRRSRPPTPPGRGRTRTSAGRRRRRARCWRQASSPSRFESP